MTQSAQTADMHLTLTKIERVRLTARLEDHQTVARRDTLGLSLLSVIRDTETETVRLTSAQFTRLRQLLGVWRDHVLADLSARSGGYHDRLYYNGGRLRDWHELAQVRS